jgi:hypothetical protein
MSCKSYDEREAPHPGRAVRAEEDARSPGRPAGRRMHQCVTSPSLPPDMIRGQARARNDKWHYGFVAG